MTCELGAVVEGHRTAPWGRERGQHLGHGTGDWVCRLARLPQGDEQTGVAFVQGEDGLPLSAEEHQVRLPVAGASRPEASRPEASRPEASAGRSDSGRRSWMKDAGLPPLRPRQPRFDLALGR